LTIYSSGEGCDRDSLTLMPDVVIILVVIRGTSFSVIFGQERIEHFALIHLVSSDCLKYRCDRQVSVPSRLSLKL
jgi:hypothetical protein